MGKTLTEKIIEKHLVKIKFKKNEDLPIKIDQTLTQDATGVLTYLQFECLGISKLKTEVSVSYVDHNTIQQGFENANDHIYLKKIAKKYGILYSKAGNGICHQLHLERFGKPGKTLLGSDSHTSTNGCIGMLAIGAGGLDVAIAMAGYPFFIKINKIIKIELKGKLNPFVSAKDIILKLISLLKTKNNEGTIIEYGGEGLTWLSVEERASITNMGAEMGIITSIFPSDNQTKIFLKRQKREIDYFEIKADVDAKYDKIITINLNELEPLIAKPHRPDNITKVKDLEGIKINQVCIGSCTNSSYRDLMIASKMLKDKKINKNVELIVVPGSQQILNMLIKNRVISTLLSAGARLAESACGFCIGISHSPSNKAISIRTNNRNFKGRSGTKSAKIYLTSVETATASALMGYIVDPRNINIKMPKIKKVNFLIDDSIFLNEYNKVEKITKGENIGKLPFFKKISDSVKTITTIKLGDKISTDQILPAGFHLKYRSNIEESAKFVFKYENPLFSKKCFENKEKGISNLIIAGESYGQGSSREHAALCLVCLGVKIIIAKSIERIHKQNLINFGIIPFIFENEKDYENIDLEDIIIFKNIKENLLGGNKLKVYNKTKRKKFIVRFDLSDCNKKILFKGGKLNFVKEIIKKEK
jgi:aconitate hydratase